MMKPLTYTDEAITRLGLVELRNKRIIEYILDEAKDEDAHIIVFACTIAHANALSTLLKLHGEATRQSHQRHQKLSRN